MEFNLIHATQILKRTPEIVDLWLRDLPEKWIQNNEGGDSWCPFDIIGHYIHGEKTDWIPRLEIILRENGPKNFEPFDRFAQFENSKGKSISDLLDEFRALRVASLARLERLSLQDDQLNLKGIHPEFGEVSLRNLLASWVVHDLAHFGQISRVMAKQYKGEVGPWINYMSVLK
ncbi:MAG: DinB family protein [Bacteroidia bacterium]|nr:DinB family protein [Bacteroidia bacterium]